MPASTQGKFLRPACTAHNVLPTAGVTLAVLFSRWWFIVPTCIRCASPISVFACARHDGHFCVIGKIDFKGPNRSYCQEASAAKPQIYGRSMPIILRWGPVTEFYVTGHLRRSWKANIWRLMLIFYEFWAIWLCTYRKCSQLVLVNTQLP